MNIDYIKLQDLTAGNNSNLIHFLNTVLNHSVDKKVWSWEFESIPKTIFTVAMAGEEIAGTQSMLPVFLNINDSIYETAKSETSFLNPVFRGKKIFEKLYQLAVDETVMNGTKLIWGFTPALKAWKNNLGFETFDDEIQFIFDQCNILDKVSRYELVKPSNVTEKSKEITQIYFSILTDDEIMKLYNIYKLDFELFEYSFEIRDLKINC